MIPKLLSFLLLIIVTLAGCNDGEFGTDKATRTSAATIEEGTDMPLSSGSYEDMLRREESMVQAVPPIPGIPAPWSGAPNLGNTATTILNSKMNQAVLKLDEWGPPEVWTISLGLTVNWPKLLTPPVRPYNVPVIARVEFGSGGATQVVKFNWLNGTRIALPMNSVTVSAEYGTMIDPATGLTIDPTDVLDLSVQLARGYAPSNCWLFETQYTVNNGGAGSLIPFGPVPAFAKSFMIDTPLISDIAYVTNAANFVDMAVKQVAAADAFRNEIELFDYTRQLVYEDHVGTAVVPILAVYRIGT